MAIKHINEKSLIEIKDEEEMAKIDVQSDIFEVVAMLYEEVEEVKAKNKTLEAKVKKLEGGVK